MHRYFVYIMASKRNGVLYIGLTNDVARRGGEHKEGKIKGFSKKYYVDRLVYFEEFQYVDQAIAREKALKKWNREWKVRLIEEANSEWKDLYEELNNLLQFN
jgi:putative endonuclease